MSQQQIPIPSTVPTPVMEYTVIPARDLAGRPTEAELTAAGVANMTADQRDAAALSFALDQLAGQGWIVQGQVAPAGDAGALIILGRQTGHRWLELKPPGLL